MRDSVDKPSNSDNSLYLFSPFTPNSLKSLKAEIKRNKENLEELKTVFKDSDIIDDVREILIDERKYYVSQKAKHLNSILEQAKKVEIHDVDADKLLKEIEDLKGNVE